MARKPTARDVANAEQKRTTAKLGRLRRKGVDISGINPIRDTSGMGTRQLRKYADQLRAFNSNRGYVAGFQGAPINRAAVDVYRNLERRNNRISQGYEQTVGGVTVPSLGQDVASQIERRNRQKFVAGGEQATFQAFNREMSDITGQESIQRLIDNMRKKTKPKYLNDRMAGYRANINTMMEQSNDELGQKALALISDEQLNILIDYSPFMNALSGRYEFQKALNADEEFNPENWMTEIFESNVDELHDLIDWAHNLDTKNGPTDRDTDSSTIDPNRRRRIVPRKRVNRKSES